MTKFATYFLALGLLASSPAHAHDTWIVPSSTMLSGEKPWVTFDAAVSNDKFYFNHRPLALSALNILAPSGSHVEPTNPFTGELRSGFDLQLAETGTYRVAIVRNGLSAQWQENGKPRRWFGSVTEFAENVPAQADKLKVQERSSRVETFVTKGKPTPIATIEEGLAIRAQTHPNDLFHGESGKFILTLDGQALPDATVELVPEGSRYRDSVQEINVTTNAAGEFSVKWPTPGRYWLHAEYQGPAHDQSGPAQERLAAYTATLEVLP